MIVLHLACKHGVQSLPIDSFGMTLERAVDLQQRFEYSYGRPAWFTYGAVVAVIAPKLRIAA